MSLLVVSNNKFSFMKNNGKTLASFFGDCDSSRLYQLSLHNDEYDIDMGSHALTISPLGLDFGSSSEGRDRNGISLFDISNINHVGGKKTASKYKKIIFYFSKFILKIKKRNFLSLLIRDLIYIPAFIISFKRVVRFAKDNDIKEVFFVYPDFFIFQVFVLYLVRATGVKLTIYFTDDYLLDFNPSDSGVNKKNGYAFLLNIMMNKLIKNNPRFFVISEKMSLVYKKIFGIRSLVLLNAAPIFSYKNTAINEVLTGSNNVKMSYFGSLHSGRKESLKKLSKIVEDFMFSSSKNIVVNIYTSDDIESFIDDFPTFINFYPPVSGDAYLEKVQESDFLLFVEGFNESDLKTTWLSCSTKIPEYLSAKKPIVAFGSIYNGSIDLIKSNNLGFLLNGNDFGKIFDSALIQQVTVLGFKYYNENFSKEIMIKRLGYDYIRK